MINYNRREIYNNAIFLKEARNDYENLILQEGFAEQLKDFGGGFVDAFASFYGIIRKKFDKINQDKMIKKITLYDKEFMAEHPGCKPATNLKDIDYQYLFGTFMGKVNKSLKIPTSIMGWEKLAIRKIKNRIVMLDITTHWLDYSGEVSGTVIGMHPIYRTREGGLLIGRGLHPDQEMIND